MQRRDPLVSSRSTVCTEPVTIKTETNMTKCNELSLSPFTSLYASLQLLLREPSAIDCIQYMTSVSRA